ncbi:hypothetical protein [Bradyrhizobium sp. C9]|uniref:hypothetical protein n=1 Tax=Bradyrhizobium sp. C9 TaxID=142585 RepID=UPI000BE87500|nr:hypothetical protein [Bradyrhizobium sp. C9]PDT73071.1 hypothetical protein CO675_32230 [Bradyrhizobium sp. C9]
MAKVSNRARGTETDSAAAELKAAHTEIMDAWFEQWRNQEQSRIDIAFKKARTTEQQRKQFA